MDRDDPAYGGQSKQPAWVFDNLGDTEDGLREILVASFERVDLETIGTMAIFAATGPRRSSALAASGATRAAIQFAAIGPAGRLGQRERGAGW